MESQDTIDTPPTDIRLDLQGAQYLSIAAGWAKFLAILGFIMVGLVILGGMIAAVGFSNYGGGSKGVFFLMFLLYAVLMFFPSLWLFNFANKSRLAIDSNDSDDLRVAMKNLKNFFLFQGIMIIILLSLYLIALVAIGI